MPVVASITKVARTFDRPIVFRLEGAPARPEQAEQIEAEPSHDGAVDLFQVRPHQADQDLRVGAVGSGL